MSDRIGKRGESIFATIITRKGLAGQFLFEPTFLGNKFPTVDFYVSLLNYPKKAFFFASVKATSLGYQIREKKLRVSIEKTELAELSKYNLPVYIFGIDEVGESGYLTPATNLDISINGITTKYPLVAANLELLHKEVSQYWDNSHKNTKFVSSFN